MKNNDRNEKLLAFAPLIVSVVSILCSIFLGVWISYRTENISDKSLLLPEVKEEYKKVESSLDEMSKAYSYIKFKAENGSNVNEITDSYVEMQSAKDKFERNIDINVPSGKKLSDIMFEKYNKGLIYVLQIMNNEKVEEDNEGKIVSNDLFKQYKKEVTDKVIRNKRLTKMVGLFNTLKTVSES